MTHRLLQPAKEVTKKYGTPCHVSRVIVENGREGVDCSHTVGFEAPHILMAMASLARDLADLAQSPALRERWSLVAKSFETQADCGPAVLRVTEDAEAGS